MIERVKEIAYCTSIVHHTCGMYVGVGGLVIERVKEIAYRTSIVS